MTTGYFGDLTFIGAHRTPRCTAWVDRTFPDYWGLQFARSGGLFLEVGQGAGFVAAPRLWFTGPGFRYRYGLPPDPGVPSRTSWDHTYVTFRGPRVLRWMDGGLLPPLRGSLDGTRFHPEPLALDLDELIVEVRHGRTPWAVHRLEKILLRLAETPSAQADPDPLSALIRDLRRDPLQEPDFKIWARDHGLSYSHFRARFRERAGMAPRQMVLALRLDGAAGDLRRGAASVVDVAARWGFDDPVYFHKMFKRRTGLAPGRFRDEAGGMVSAGGKYPSAQVCSIAFPDGFPASPV